MLLAVCPFAFAAVAVAAVAVAAVAVAAVAVAAVAAAAVAAVAVVADDVSVLLPGEVQASNCVGVVLLNACVVV